MTPVATETQAWITVRCPGARATLGEVRGTGGEVRRVCPKCKGWWIVRVSDGAVRLDESAVWMRASA